MANRRRAALFSLLVFWFQPCLGADEGIAKANPARIEAAFLRNFAHYVSWPSHAFAGDQTPWRVCILGADPFGELLEDTFKGRLEQGRSFVVVRADSAADARPCQIAYLAYRSSESRRAALAELANRPVLTVGDDPAFLHEGGMIRFQVSDHVGFGVNLDRANAAALKIPTKMLEVAHEVVENGVARGRR